MKVNLIKMEKMKGKGIMKYNNGEIHNGEWDNDNKKEKDYYI